MWDNLVILFLKINLFLKKLPYICPSNKIPQDGK